MSKAKPSGPAVFMYTVMALCVILCAGGFITYYTGICPHSAIKWSGVVPFMILYHFGLRLLFGVFSTKYPPDYRHPWYTQRGFEKKLYKLLRVRRWKDKVLTFEPDKYDFQKRTLDQLASTMAKSELDHLFNELISVASIFFGFVWGCFPAFVISAIAAMLFDAQFIVVQRYNRPIVLKLMKLRTRKCEDLAKNN